MLLSRVWPGLSDSVLDKGRDAERYAQRQVERADEDAIDPTLRETNDRYFVVKSLGGKFRVCHEVRDDELNRYKLVAQRREDFTAAYMNRFVTVGAKTTKDGKTVDQSMPAGEWWLRHEHRRQYEQVVFKPSGEAPGEYNLWRGFSCDPTEGDWRLLDWHMFEVVCGPFDTIRRMSYRSETIATAIGRMNRQYFLPAIQREFVWKPEQVAQLFDSIMRGYPISSFLFWELKPENRDKWQVYKFLEKAYHGGTHNELANTDGLPNLALVLDGQQRLTSLLIGLRGTYVAKKKYKRWDNPDAWSDQRLHLDLLAEPRLDEDGADAGLYYKFEFMEDAPEPDAEHHWFRVGRILDFDERAKFEKYLDEQDDKLAALGLAKTERRVFERNLKRLYEAVHVDEVIAYYTETDQDYDRVLDIFVRMADYLTLNLYVGLRKSNGIGLRWAWVNLDAATITVPATETKTKKELVVNIPAPVLAMLKRRHADTERHTVFVFPNRRHDDRPMNSPGKAHEVVLKVAGLPDDAVTIHDMRRTLGSAMIAQGADVSEVREQLGHANIATTSIYLNLGGEDTVKKSLERTAAAFGEEPTKPAAKPDEPKEEAA